MKDKHSEFLRRLKEGSKKTQSENHDDKIKVTHREEDDILELQQQLSKRFDELFGVANDD